MKTNYFYIFSILFLIFIVPIFGALIESNLLSSTKDLFNLIAKWFIFSALGLRLTTAGLKQILNPDFTLKIIFNLPSNEYAIIVRELGFSNLCIGMLGLLSIFLNQFFISAAISGGLFLGLAGFYHLISKPKNLNQKIAMISDLFIFLITIIITIVKIK